MPPTRWAKIINTAYSPDVQAIIDKQERGMPLTLEDRRSLVDADNMIRSEIAAWQNGEPDILEDVPTDAATPVPGAPPDLGPPDTAPLDLGPPMGPPVPDNPEDRTTGMDTGGESISPMGPPPQDTSPLVPAGAFQQAPIIPTAGLNEEERVPPGSAAIATYTPPAPPPPTAAEAPRGGSRDVDTQPGAPVFSTGPGPIRPATPAPSPPRATRPPPDIGPPTAPRTPAPAPPPKPAAPPPPPPKPRLFEGANPNDPLIAPSPFRTAIERAGGRATRPIAERTAQQIGDIQRGGFQGRNEGWTTEEKMAADAWLDQYHRRPESLDPAERRAYERDPGSLLRTISDDNGPFYNYKESWIGAYRNGDIVPKAKEFDAALQGYPGYESPSFKDMEQPATVDMGTPPSDAGTPLSDTGAPPEPPPDIGPPALADQARDDYARPGGMDRGRGTGLSGIPVMDDYMRPPPDAVAPLPEEEIPDEGEPDSDTDDSGDTGDMEYDNSYDQGNYGNDEDTE